MDSAETPPLTMLSMEGTTIETVILTQEEEDAITDRLIAQWEQEEALRREFGKHYIPGLL